MPGLLVMNINHLKYDVRNATAKAWILNILLVFILMLSICMVPYLLMYAPIVASLLITISLLVFCIFIVLAFNARSISRFNYIQMAYYAMYLPTFLWGCSFLFPLFVSGHFKGVNIVSKYIQKWIPSKVRMPNGDIRGIAIDDTGFIYCYSYEYNRIQLFDANGQFLRGWFVDIPHGEGLIMMDEDDNLRIASKSNKMNYYYDSQGQLMKKSPLHDWAGEYRLSSFYEARDRYGNTYKPRHSLLYSGVDKIMPGGDQLLLIRQPFGLWLINAPSPVMLFLLMSVLLCALRPLSKRIIRC